MLDSGRLAKLRPRFNPDDLFWKYRSIDGVERDIEVPLELDHLDEPLFQLRTLLRLTLDPLLETK